MTVVAPAGVLQIAPAAPSNSFRDLAREQLPRLLSIARRLVGDDAEDAVQDCLLKAFQKFDQLHDPGAAERELRDRVGRLVRVRDRRGGVRREDDRDVELHEVVVGVDHARGVIGRAHV